MQFLGVDIGTGGSRAVVIDSSGNMLATAGVEHEPFDSPQIGWAEQVPEDWWRAATLAIRSVLASEGIKAQEIGAVSFSGQMHGSVFLDAAGDVLRPALLWCDQRTEKQCFEITEKVGASRLIELTSNPAVTGFTLPKILWLRENEPEVWKKVRQILLPKDYIRLRLSGDSATDVADASGTLLFNTKDRKWSSEMMEAFEIDASFLPSVFESTEITGSVSRKGAEATGLLEGTPIIAGAGDNAAGAIGMGIVSPGTVSATIGTSGVVFVVTEGPKIDLEGRVHSLCHAMPNTWHMTGVTLAAGLSLKWFRDNVGNKKTYEQLTGEAEKIPAGSDGALWLPYLMGERTPYRDPNVRAAFVGLSASHTNAHLARAVMEGVAFSLLDCLEIFRELGTPIEKIRLGGGGARSHLWSQIQADVYGQSVEIVEADEGAAFGAAILAGVGVKAWPTVAAACEETIRVKQTIDPDPESVEILETNYRAYRTLYAALKPAMTIFSGRG